MSIDNNIVRIDVGESLKDNNSKLTKPSTSSRRQKWYNGVAHEFTMRTVESHTSTDYQLRCQAKHGRQLLSVLTQQY